MFHVCEKCQGTNFKVDKVKLDRDLDVWKFLIRCDGCSEAVGYEVHNEHLMGFLMCPEIISVFGPLIRKGEKVVINEEQVSMW